MLVEVFGGEVREAGEVRFVEFADDEGDAGGAGELVIPGEGLEGAVDADGQDGGGGFGDEEANAGLGREQIAIKGAGALGKHEDTTAAFKQSDGGLQAGGIRFVAINRDGLPTAQDFANKGVVEEGFAGKEVNGVREGLTDEGRIKKGSVIAADEGGAVKVKAGFVDDAEVKQAMGELAEELFADGVTEIHWGEAALPPEMGDGREDEDEDD